MHGHCGFCLSVDEQEILRRRSGLTEDDYVFVGCPLQRYQWRDPRKGEDIDRAEYEAAQEVAKLSAESFLELARQSGAEISDEERSLLANILATIENRSGTDGGGCDRYDSGSPTWRQMEQGSTKHTGADRKFNIDVYGFLPYS